MRLKTVAAKASPIALGFVALLVRQLKARRRMRSEFEITVETSPDCILFVNSAYKITFVNPAGEMLLGMATDSILGKPVSGTLPGIKASRTPRGDFSLEAGCRELIVDATCGHFGQTKTIFLRDIAVLLLLVSPGLLSAQTSQSPPPTPQPVQQLQPGQTGVAGLPNQPQHTAKEAQEAASNPNGLSWDDIKAKFEVNNPTLKADELNVQESRAQEITAYLRPNPTANELLDQTYPFGPHYDPNVPGTYYRPLTNSLTTGNISYLHERDGKRELRLESAQQGTAIALAQHENLERTLLQSLRAQFVGTLQAKAVLALTREELDYYDHLIEISKLRYQKGDIAEIDFDRIELQRVQYESQLETAVVNLRQAKIVLIQLLNDKIPVEQFDIKGNFDFKDSLMPLEAFQRIAISERPDLRAAYEQVQQAFTNHRLAVANGSTDPTLIVDAGTNPPLGPYVGVGVNFPLRIFDRNQGEKARTLIDITKNQHQQDAANAQVFSDVDSAYVQVASTVNLLRPYKAKYLDQATRVRDTVTYAYQRGGASLLDLLGAQNDFRTTELAYLQLIGTYLTAASQLNLAVGREVIQ